MQYRFRIEAEKLKRQPDENIKSYIDRFKTLDVKWWPTPSDADAEAQTAAKNSELDSIKTPLYVV